MSAPQKVMDESKTEGGAEEHDPGIQVELQNFTTDGTVKPPAILKQTKSVADIEQLQIDDDVKKEKIKKQTQVTSGLRDQYKNMDLKAVSSTTASDGSIKLPITIFRVQKKIQ